MNHLDEVNIVEDQHINQESLNDLKDIMEDDFGLLIETFIADSHVRIEALETALVNSDADGVRAAAHSFKGSSSNICAPLLADICKDLETCGRDGDLSAAPALFADVKTEFATVNDLLTALI
jgi:HPt (histidine-containing phosphotransfer) domain-containing protein